jgi:hypothetical protein
MCTVLAVIDNAAAEDQPTSDGLHDGLPTGDHIQPPASNDASLEDACIKCLNCEGYNLCSKCKKGFCHKCIDGHERLCCPPAPANRYFLDPKVKAPQMRLVGGVPREFTVITTNVIESGNTKSSLYSDDHSCQVCVQFYLLLYILY